MHEFPVPAGPQQFTLQIKRSRFITSVNLAHGAAAAKRFIDSIASQWPDANHHCWAYLAGQPGDLRTADKSDDGEPRGTAGMPMLNVLTHSGIGHIVVVVTRYFGGIKLGAGGLVRAYTRCVSDAVRQLDTEHWLATQVMIVSLPYSLLARVEHWLGSSRTVVTDRAFAEGVRLSMKVPIADKHEVITCLESIGQGAITLSGPDGE